jgi:hypothetical protein
MVSASAWVIDALEALDHAHRNQVPPLKSFARRPDVSAPRLSVLRA